MTKQKRSLPRFSEYFPPALAALKARGGSATIEEMEDEVARLMQLTEEQLSFHMGRGHELSSSMSLLGFEHS